MDFPIVNIIITTYDNGDGKRTPLLNLTVDRLLNNLKYPNLNWIIADDGSPQQIDHLDDVRQQLKDNFTLTNALRAGVGKSKNLALVEAFKLSPLVLMLEDDWILTRQLDLIDYVKILDQYDEIGMIRLGYLGGTMQAYLTSYNDITFWDLERGSGVYIYSGQVSLRHERFYNACGFHPEGVDAGTEELDMCKKYNGIETAPKIVWPASFGCTLNSPNNLFHNIGMNDSLNNVQPEV